MTGVGSSSQIASIAVPSSPSGIFKSVITRSGWVVRQVAISMPKPVPHSDPVHDHSDLQSDFQGISSVRRNEFGDPCKKLSFPVRSMRITRITVNSPVRFSQREYQQSARGSEVSTGQHQSASVNHHPFFPFDPGVWLSRLHRSRPNAT